jgi:hypothetical protein
MLLAIDRFVMGNASTPVMRPQAVFPELAQEDPHRMAETLSMLKQAQAASIETRVRMTNPEWEQERIDAEVAAIKAEEMIVSDPTGGFV